MAKKSKTKTNTVRQVYGGFENNFAYLYIVVMLGLFPLFFRDNYINITASKYGFFLISTGIAGSIIALIAIIKAIVYRYELVFPKTPKEFFNAFSITDKFAALIIIIELISLAGTSSLGYTAEAIDGTLGKRAGVLLFLGLVTAYYICSRCVEFDTVVLSVCLFANIMVFGIAVLNHFLIDPMGMYTNLAPDNYWMFITTMGNINVVAGYYCVFIPITMAFFLFETSKIKQILSCIAMIISFMGIVASNGDSSFLGLGAIFLFLFVMSFKNLLTLQRFFTMSALFFISAAVIGALSDAFPDSIKDPLDTFPAFMSNSVINRISIVFFIALAVLMYYLNKKYTNEKNNAAILKKCQLVSIIFIIVLVISGIGTLLYFSVIDTAKDLGSWDIFLRFSDSWGSARGFTWRRVITMYNEQYSIFQKLFGFGPDLLRIPLHTYFNDEIFAQMGAYLVDAHNEPLQMLGTRGLFGMIAYMGFILSAIIRIIKNNNGNVGLISIAAGAIGYSVQAMMSCPQTFGTPGLFLMLGIGEGMLRIMKKSKKTNNKS